MNSRAIPLCVTWCGMSPTMTRARRATRNKVTENVASVAGFAVRRSTGYSYSETDPRRE